MVSITIKTVLPKRKFSTKKWLDEIAKAQRLHSVPYLRKLFRQSVFGWSKKPEMGWSQKKSMDEIEIKIYARGEGSDVWNMLNQGIPPHSIYPKKQGGLLWFRPGYKSATRPGTLQSRRAYRSGKLRPAKSVQHPGVQARKFTKIIAEEYGKDYAMDMQAAVTKAARRK